MRSKLAVALLLLFALSISIVAMPITAAEDTSESGTETTSPVSPMASTPNITITVNDSSNGLDTARTDVKIADPGNNQTLPAELSTKGVTADKYNAVVGADSRLSATNLAPAIRSWAGSSGKRGFIGGTRVRAGDLSAMINYWKTLS